MAKKSDNSVGAADAPVDVPDVSQTDIPSDAPDIPAGQEGTEERTLHEGEGVVVQEAAPADLHDVNELIRERGLPAWQGAALCRYAGWAPGKAVSAVEFEAALSGLANRPMGGGR